MKKLIIVFIIIFFIPALSLSDEFKIPHRFEAGQDAVAEVFNENNKAIEDEINRLRINIKEFEAGQPAKAEEVNENFKVLRNAIAELQNEKIQLQKSIEALQASLNQFLNNIQVLSVDHKSGKTGMYFNFWIRDVDRILGNANWDNKQVAITNQRTHKNSKAKLWRSSSGGSIGNGHGRWDDGNSAPDLWQAGDVFIINK